jgi:hypothetical protein
VVTQLMLVSLIDMNNLAKATADSKERQGKGSDVETSNGVANDAENLMTINVYKYSAKEMLAIWQQLLEKVTRVMSKVKRGGSKSSQAAGGASVSSNSSLGASVSKAAMSLTLGSDMGASSADSSKGDGGGSGSHKSATSAETAVSLEQYIVSSIGVCAQRLHDVSDDDLALLSKISKQAANLQAMDSNSRLPRKIARKAVAQLLSARSRCVNSCYYGEGSGHRTNALLPQGHQVCSRYLFAAHSYAADAYSAAEPGGTEEFGCTTVGGVIAVWSQQA